MTGERLPKRERPGFYYDFPWLPSWNQVMAQEGLPQRLEVIMTALKPARRLKPIGPELLEPIGLADWVDPVESRRGSSTFLQEESERVDFGDAGQLLGRRRYRHDDRGRPNSLIEADYNNLPTEPLTTTKPTAIRAHGWSYDDKSGVATLVGARYAEYSQPIEGLVEQAVSAHWFVPPRPIPLCEAEFVGVRLESGGEIAAHYLGGQPIMLSARVGGPGLAARRRLKVELKQGEVEAVELVNRLPGSERVATFDVKRGPDGKLVQNSRNPRLEAGRG